MPVIKETIKRSLPFITAAWAAFCPLCYLAPLLIGAGATSALFFTALWGEKILIALILVSLLGFYLSYKVHKSFFPFTLGMLAGGLMYYGKFINFNLPILYLGSLIMTGGAVVDIILRRSKGNCDECKVVAKGGPTNG